MGSMNIEIVKDNVQHGLLSAKTRLIVDMLEKLQGINGVLQTDILYSGTNKKVIE